MNESEIDFDKIENKLEVELKDSCLQKDLFSQRTEKVLKIDKFLTKGFIKSGA